MSEQARLDRETDRDLAPVFRALADPTRREILDLLREGPMTTGDLARRFDQTRFGVMKHLGVLVEADLVIVRRDGRQRWNHLNPMPIHEMARRWVRPFERLAGDRLLRLKHHAEAAAAEVATEDLATTNDEQRRIEDE